MTGHLRRLAERAGGAVASGALLPRLPSLFEPLAPTRLDGLPAGPAPDRGTSSGAAAAPDVLHDEPSVPAIEPVAPGTAGTRLGLQRPSRAPTLPPIAVPPATTPDLASVADLADMTDVTAPPVRPAATRPGAVRRADAQLADAQFADARPADARPPAAGPSSGDGPVDPPTAAPRGWPMVTEFPPPPAEPPAAAQRGPGLLPAASRAGDLSPVGEFRTDPPAVVSPVRLDDTSGPAERSQATAPIATPSPGATPRPAVQADLPTPPPFAPTAPVPVLPAANQTSQFVAGARRRAEDERVVHVTIGRIEVRAAPQPAPPVEQPAPAAVPEPPISLERYLAERRLRS